MEIAPIAGIRAVSLLHELRTENTEHLRIEIEASARADDETYSSNSQTPDRGLGEDNSGSAEGEGAEPATSSASTVAGSKIDLLA